MTHKGAGSIDILLFMNTHFRYSVRRDMFTQHIYLAHNWPNFLHLLIARKLPCHQIVPYNTDKSHMVMP